MPGAAYRITEDGGGSDFVYVAHQSNRGCKCPSHWHKQIAEYHGIVGIDDLGMGSSVARAMTNGILFKLQLVLLGHRKLDLLIRELPVAICPQKLLQFVNYN